MTSSTKIKILVVGIFVAAATAGFIAETKLREHSEKGWALFVPEEWTRAAWDSLQKCAGVQSKITYDHLDWREGEYMVPGIFSGGTRRTHGAFDRKTNTIYLMSKYKYSETFLRHEMMHAVLTPLGGHPEFAFNRKCGTIID